MDQKQDGESSILTIIGLSLFPGILYVITALLIAPLVESIRYPSIFTLVIADLICIVIIEGLILSIISKKKTNSFNFKQIIPYRKKLPIGHFIGYALILVVYGFLILSIINPLANLIKISLFSWMPAVFLTESVNPLLYTQEALIVTTIFAFIIIGVAVPIVEEYYFRGYLMSRISRFKNFAPLIIVALWSIYHLWSLWNVIGFIILYYPIAYVVKRKENVYLSMLVHSVANLNLVILVAGSMFF